VGPASRACRLFDLHDCLVPYEQAWEWQRTLVARQTQLEAGSTGPPGHIHNSLLLLQHPPVFTLGAGSTTDNLLFNPDTCPIPLHRTERGGEVTYHGPGQLVMYPILDLARCHRTDLHWYLRTLEEVVIRALDTASGLQGERVEGAKVAAIGIRAKKWVTYHGLALNISTDLAPFKTIVPCGIADKPVASVQGLLEDRAMSDDPFVSELEGAQSSQQLLKEYRYALLDAFSELFDLRLEEGDAAADLPGAAQLLLGCRQVPAGAA